MKNNPNAERHVKWAEVDCLKPLNTIKNTKLFNKCLSQELVYCVKSHDFKPHLFDKTSRLRADPVSAFVDNLNVKITHETHQVSWQPENILFIFQNSFVFSS